MLREVNCLSQGHTIGGTDTRGLLSSQQLLLASASLNTQPNSTCPDNSDTMPRADQSIQKGQAGMPSTHREEIID